MMFFIEHMLNAELDAHLDNEEHEKNKDGNYRLEIRYLVY